MSKLSEAIQADRLHKGPRCTVSVLLERLPKAERAELLAAIGDRSLASATISRALASLGHTLPQFVLQRHRRGDCGCNR